jgi:hypothetical protein
VGDVRGWRLKAPRPGYPPPVTVGTLVQKTGRTTGWTTGRLIAINATVDVNYGSGRVARFQEQLISTNMSAPGDSGSLLPTWDNVAVGLLFAAADTILILIESPAARPEVRAPAQNRRGLRGRDTGGRPDLGSVTRLPILDPPVSVSDSRQSAHPGR